MAFIQTPSQKERLDPMQLTQMTAIVLFHLNPGGSEPRHRLALQLLFFLIEQLVYMLRPNSDPDDSTLAPIQVALAFLVHFKSGSLLADNALWKSSSNVEKFVRAMIKFANDWRLIWRRATTSDAESSSPNLSINDLNRPLVEDRILESYLPMKEAHKDINFKLDVSVSKIILKFFGPH